MNAQKKVINHIFHLSFFRFNILQKRAQRTELKKKMEIKGDSYWIHENHAIWIEKPQNYEYIKIAFNGMDGDEQHQATCYCLIIENIFGYNKKKRNHKLASFPVPFFRSRVLTLSLSLLLIFTKKNHCFVCVCSNCSDIFSVFLIWFCRSACHRQRWWLFFFYWFASALKFWNKKIHRLFLSILFLMVTHNLSVIWNTVFDTKRW